MKNYCNQKQIIRIKWMLVDIFLNKTIIVILLQLDEDVFISFDD